MAAFIPALVLFCGKTATGIVDTEAGNVAHIQARTLNTVVVPLRCLVS